MRSLMRILILTIVVVTFAAFVSSGSGRADESSAGLDVFKKHVRTILVHKCLKCHGGKSTKGDFNLATRKDLMDSGFVEKTAKDSHLMRLITHAEEPHMPFKSPKLSLESIKRIGQWIDLGAPYDKPLTQKAAPKGPMVVTDEDRQFWSFQPLNVRKPPQTKNAKWARTDVDRFVLAQLESNQLAPNAVASRRVLIRRVYFDLIGLPPSPEEVAAFEKDEDPQAWAKLIDRLLESKSYGERWARHWMDVARFAESHGYEQDYDRPHAYHYRDFLIRALNSDMPYNQFVQWQLAGDELAPDEPLALMATGFLGAGVFPTQLTETEFESTRYDELDDMVTTTGVAFLGLSVGCARCHDHKFDPFPTKDYYRMAATFTRTIRSEIDVDLDSAGNVERKQKWQTDLAKLEKELADYDTRQTTEAFKKWLAKYEPTGDVGPWDLLVLNSVVSSAGTQFEIVNGAALAKSGPPNKEVISVVTRMPLQSLRAIRLEALTHSSFPRKGPGRAANGNFALGDFKVSAVSLKSKAKPQQLKFASARATHQQNTSSLSVAASIDNDPVSGWAVDAGGIGKDQAAIFELAEPFVSDTPIELTITLTLNHPNAKHTLGHFRLSVTSQAQVKPSVGQPKLSRTLVESLVKAKQTQDPKSSEWKQASEFFRSIDPLRQSLLAKIAAHRNNGPKTEKTKVMVSSEGLPHMKHHADGRGYPHFYPQTHVLSRGDVNQKQEVAEPGFLQVVSPAGATTSTWQVAKPANWTRTTYQRASLANWMTDTKQGAGQLAARVMVNRVWQHHFGRGIVGTPNDFGFQGDRPTHPELLDWLANEFITGGWKLKKLHRLIMTSSVYMQNGDFDESRAKIDRANLYYWRRASRRLEAEAIRDSMLQIAGQLDNKMFGPGTLDQNMKRRSVYFFIKRSKLIPSMMLFDWPEHLVSIGQRGNTTIAPQALMFMNSPQGRSSAKALASLLSTTSTAEAVSEAYFRTFGRGPTADESELAVSFLAQQTKLYTSQKRSGADLVAMTDLCQLLFGMNEFVYID
jgi:hypothetical protein